MPPRCASVGPGLLVLAISALSIGGCSEPEPPPNLLVIAVDTLRADHLGTYGYDRPTSPAIDRFFETAVVFDEAHATAPWTLPSFASLLTSQYTSTHACWNMSSRLDDSFTTLAEMLRDSGYHTGAVVSHTFLGKRYGLAQGFIEHDDSLVYTPSKSNLAISSPPVTDKSIAFLERQVAAERPEPWFLWSHYFDPHTSYLRHKGITERFGRGLKNRYDGEIAFTDGHIGRLLQRLDELELAKNTIVVFVADHGEEFMDHGNTGHGKTLYREVERIPFAIRAPGIPPRRVPDVVSVVDFVPTALDLLGLPKPDVHLSGRSLVGTMHGQPLLDHGVLLEARPSALKVDLAGYVLGNWKLILETPGKHPDGPPSKTMLFDLEANPRETRNLAVAQPDVVAELTARLQQAVAEARATATWFSQAEEVQLTDAEREDLRALGYVEAGATGERSK